MCDDDSTCFPVRCAETFGQLLLEKSPVGSRLCCAASTPAPSVHNHSLLIAQLLLFCNYVVKPVRVKSGNGGAAAWSLPVKADLSLSREASV